MNRSLRAVVLVCLTIGCGWVCVINAQFYPEAHTCWDGGDDDGRPPGYFVRYQMGDSPDTLNTHPSHTHGTSTSNGGIEKVADANYRKFASG
ncbi:MAG: hypothetical protein IPL64_02550 [Flavobacteriales bacterium]|jgi:hypothetical protein|nr:hypothetical protein [Flavobacteriales bacterium]MBK6550151.1 hypothetical protein [Flavobacteriales bacterium]MBK7102661.1 hypothetical protein [Flavobacteriales bacterium]MBK7619636.1 hypothetical protein [Flavobacteriales bacterium]MBK8530757.1 hypothetical protein [Flavobacteriales bacterium]